MLDVIKDFFVGGPNTYSGPFALVINTPLSKFLFIGVLLAIIIGIIYLKLAHRELDNEHKENMKKYFLRPEVQQQKSERWVHVEKLFRSTNSSDWRVAIMEADVMLEEALIQMGYKGVSLGERLKSVSKSDFPKYDLAWKAHKVRNRIAHQAMGGSLSHREAWQTFQMYEQVFRANHII